MEQNRFDDLTRELGRGASRRSLVKALAGGLFAGLATWGASGKATAFVCRQPGVLCGKNAHCCSGGCGPDHRCTCEDDLTLCNRACVILENDSANCGECDAACGVGQVCLQGDCCTPECTGQCGGADDGCGGTCDGDCPAGQLCAGQLCVVGQGTCPAGADSCGVFEGIPCNGRDDCNCYTSTEGDTRCSYVVFPGGDAGCGECVSSADCATKYPTVPGAFCLRPVVGTGCCGSPSGGVCLAPCLS